MDWLSKFLKFGVVGGSGVFVDFGITYICKEYLKIQKFVSNAIGFAVAASTNYYLNRVWTFESTNPEFMSEYFKFLVISFIGLGINTTVLWFFSTKKNVNFYFSKLLAIGVTTIWNFLINYLYTFS